MEKNGRNILAKISVRSPELLESITLDEVISVGSYVWEYNKLAQNLKNRVGYESWDNIFNDFKNISEYVEDLGLNKDFENKGYNSTPFFSEKRGSAVDKNLFIANSYLIMKMYNEEFENMMNYKNDNGKSGYSPLAQRRDQVAFLSTPVDPSQAKYLERMLNN